MRRHVGAPAEVDEAGRVLVEAHDARLGDGGRVVDGALDDLPLVAVVAEDGEPLRHRALPADERLALGDDLPHAGLDAREVVGGERAAVGQLEVVVEAVLDRRADAEGGAGPQVEHRLGHDVRGRVADRVEAALALRGDDGDGGPVGQGVAQVALDAVDVDDDRRLGQPGTDGAGQIRARSRLRAVAAKRRPEA